MMTNITIARSLLLLLFLIGCRHAIDVYDEIEYDDGSTRLQLRTSRSFEISQIFCNSTSPQTDEADVFNYDCSNRTLKWSSLRRLMDHVRASTNLNLGNNLLGEESPVAANLSFNLFKQLKRLDVSANGLEAADLHAFFYTDQVSDTVNTSVSVPVKPLSLVTLNLTFNRFVRLPWLAIRRLHDLEVLDLSGNPLSAFDFGDWNPTTDDELVQNWELFQNLKEIYVRSAEINRVDAGIFSYLTQLIKLDLSQNKLRHLSVDLRQPLESLGDFKELNVNKNPLVCDCHLIWLKEFFAYKEMKSEASCLINTREPNVNAIVETNLVYINSSYKTQQNYFKVTKIRNDPSRRENGLGESETRLTELRDDQFYCNMKLSGDVKDMTILKESKQQMIYITCSVRSYPAAKIMWLLGQRHLVKTSLYENTTQFSTLSKFSKLEAHYASVYNATEHLYTLNSTLQVSYYGHIGKVNFSCVSSYNRSAPSPTVASKPEHLLQTIQFNVNSDDDLLDLVDGSSNDYVVNSTVLMMKEAVGIEHSSMFHNRPVIYWVLLVICIVFVISVAIVLLSVCTVRRCRHNKRKERESEVPNYAYSTYTASNYSTINKRSALYLNKTPTLQMHQHYHNNPTLGKSPIAADLSSCSSAMIPLKPDVIREHKDHSSIYYRMGTTSRGGHLSSTPSNDEYSSRRSTPAPHQQHFGSSAISKHSYDRRTEPSSIISRNNGTNTMSTPSTTEESVSSTSTASSKRESTRSSKSFDEENIEEYLEPECPDLSKPPPKNHKSSSPDS